MVLRVPWSAARFAAARPAVQKGSMTVARHLIASSLVLSWVAWFAQGEGADNSLPAQPAQVEVSAKPEEAALPEADEERDGPITGSRDLLARFGIDDSQFGRLADLRPFGPDDEETMLRVMYRLDRFRLVDLEGWSLPRFDVAEVFSTPDRSRGEVFWLSGRVTAIEKLEPVPEVVERFELPTFYRCTLELEPQGQQAQVFVKNVPVDWKIQEGPLDERATAYGIFLKFAGPDADRAVPVFVAPRLAWHPPTLLGDLGMDVGLFEEIQNRRPLTVRDREAFYQLLAAVGRTKPGALSEAARQALATAPKPRVWTDVHGVKRWSVVPLFNEPELQYGVLVELEGAARRAERIEVRDPDIVARFGVDHYYQIALYTPDSQRNPLWVCVRELPPGMPLGADGEYGEHVRVAAFFFKTWAYRRGRTPEEISAGETGQWQLAPLLIGSHAVWYPPAIPRPNPYIGAIAGGLFVLTLIGVWIATWQYSRGDRQFHQRTIAKEYAVPSGVSLDEMGFEATPEPDFRYLAAADTGPAAAEAATARAAEGEAGVAGPGPDSTNSEPEPSEP